MLTSSVTAVSFSASLFPVSGGSHMLADIYGNYLGSGYHRKLIEYPMLDPRLLKKCLQKVSSSVLGSLIPFSMTEFIITRLRGAEHWDWMMSRSGLRRSIISRELSMPSLLEFISNIVGAWPLIVVFLKRSVKTTESDNSSVK